MKNAGLIVLALALLAGSVFAYRHFSREQRQSQDFPEGAHWLCFKCNQGFTVTLAEVNHWASSDPARAGGYPCPKCQTTETARARKCPLPGCGKFYVERNLVINEKVCCPVCRKPLP